MPERQVGSPISIPLELPSETAMQLASTYMLTVLRSALLAAVALTLVPGSGQAELNYITEQKGTIYSGEVLCLTLSSALSYDSEMSEKQMKQIGCMRAPRGLPVKAAGDPIDGWQKVRVLEVDDALFCWVRTYATSPSH